MAALRSVVGLAAGAVAVLASASAFAQQDPTYGPAKPAKPALAPGSAAPPVEDGEAAAPTGPTKYPPPADVTGAGLSPHDKRPATDYGAERDEPSVALWIPRVILAPLYFVTEYLVRRPLGALVMAIERHNVPQRFLYYSSFGTYGSNHAIGILPTAEFEWGIRANIGFILFWNHPGNAMRLSAAIGGPDWERVGFSDRVVLGQRTFLTANTSFERRADFRFWGIGPSSPKEGYFFRTERIQTGFAFQHRYWRSSDLEASSQIRSARFEEYAPDSPDVASGVASGALRLPAGFHGYTVAAQHLLASLDSRRARTEGPNDKGSDFIPPPGDGVRLEAHAEHDNELDRAHGEWIRYGGGVGFYKDLTGTQRTLGLALSTEVLSRTRNAEVPFIELVSLGGMEPMRAFRFYRLLGESSVVGKLSYSWPIWTGFDGITEAALGNVFGHYYDGFAARLLRGSFCLGLQTTAVRDVAFQIIFGAGTKTIDDGFGIESYRFVAGTTTEF